MSLCLYVLCVRAFTDMQARANTLAICCSFSNFSARTSKNSSGSVLPTHQSWGVNSRSLCGNLGREMPPQKTPEAASGARALGPTELEAQRFLGAGRKLAKPRRDSCRLHFFSFTSDSSISMLPWLIITRLAGDLQRQSFMNSPCFCGLLRYLDLVLGNYFY